MFYTLTIIYGFIQYQLFLLGSHYFCFSNRRDHVVILYDSFKKHNVLLLKQTNSSENSPGRPHTIICLVRIIPVLLAISVCTYNMHSLISSQRTYVLNKVGERLQPCLSHCVVLMSLDVSYAEQIVIAVV